MGFFHSLFYKDIKPEDIRLLGMPKGVRGERFTTKRGSVIEYFAEENRRGFVDWFKVIDHKALAIFGAMVISWMVILITAPKIWPGIEKNDLVSAIVAVICLCSITLLPIGYMDSMQKKMYERIKEALRDRKDTFTNPDHGGEVFRYLDVRDMANRQRYDFGLTCAQPGWLCIEADMFHARLNAEDIEFEIGKTTIVANILVIHAHFDEITWSMKIINPRANKIRRELEERLAGRVEGARAS